MFGWFATFMLLKTGNIAGPIGAHMFCNFMGLPDFDFFDRRQPLRSFVLLTIYWIGILGFGLGLQKI
jgi:prenyl protein peptidase